MSSKPKPAPVIPPHIQEAAMRQANQQPVQLTIVLDESGQVHCKTNVMDPTVLLYMTAQFQAQIALGMMHPQVRENVIGVPPVPQEEKKVHIVDGTGLRVGP